MSNDDPSLTAREFQDEVGPEWRALGVGACSWFAADSHAAGAELVQSVVAAVEAAADPGVAMPFVEVRATGVRVRLAPDEGSFTASDVSLARTISTAARNLGLAADPSVLQDVQLTFDAMAQQPVMGFWEEALGYDRVGDDDLVDPLRRHPPIWFQDQDAPRPLRNRIHLDSVAPQEQVARAVPALARAGAAVRDNGYYATVSDAEGNEVDLLPQVEGADRWEVSDGADVSDWRLVFSAVACYRVDGPIRAAEFISAVAALADRAGLALGIDLRPGVVVLDTGKDVWEDDPGYAPLAARAQTVARELGLVADPSLARFVQVGIDAVDIPAVREFWRVTLGYREDPREGVTDIVDPRRLNTVLFFQDLEAADTERRAQRNRIHVDVFLADDQAEERVAAALAAGGTLVRESSRPQTWTIADPEGNEVDITYSVGREELFRQLSAS